MKPFDEREIYDNQGRSPQHQARNEAAMSLTWKGAGILLLIMIVCAIGITGAIMAIMGISYFLHLWR